MKIYFMKHGGFGFGIEIFIKPVSIHFTVLLWQIAVYFEGGMNES
jgi:hypothetical protein